MSTAPLKITMRSPGSLIPYERNPRKNDAAVAVVAKSIREFGFRNPVLLDQDGVVIAGHTRLKAAQQLLMKEIPCVVIDDLTPAQVKALRIADNSTAQVAEWNLELLNLELAELPEYNFEEYGLDLSELKPEHLAEDDGFNVEDAVKAIRIPKTQRGQIYQLGRHRLMCGDATSTADLAALLGKVRPALCITDPPYGLGDSYTAKNKYNLYEDTKENLVTLVNQFVPLMIERCACTVLTCGNGNQYIYPQPTWVMAWFVPWGSAPGPWGWCCWQPILCYGKDPKLAKGDGCYPDAIVPSHKESSSVALKDLDHPCPKPIGFWSWLLERASEPTENVLDPFGGSGTTLIVAEQLGRTSYSMELDPVYCDIMIERWQALTGQTAKTFALAS